LVEGQVQQYSFRADTLNIDQTNEAFKALATFNKNKIF
jgi:hypothetical protein